MVRGIHLQVERVETVGVEAEQWSIRANGKLVGLVERATISVHGGPEWIAMYYQGSRIVTHPTVFSGDFANVEAVSLILDRARV